MRATALRIHSLRASLIRDLVEHPSSVLNRMADYPDKTGDILQHYGYRANPMNIDPAAIIKLAHEELEYLRQRNAETLYRVMLNTRVVAASSIFFSVNITDYDGLVLNVSIAPLASLSEVFQGDVMAFKTFLESSLPEVFTECLPHKFRLRTTRLRYMVTIPDGFLSLFMSGTSDFDSH